MRNAIIMFFLFQILIGHAQYDQVINIGESENFYGVDGVIDNNGNHYYLANKGDVGIIGCTDRFYNHLWLKEIDVFFGSLEGSILQLSSGDFIINMSQASDGKGHVLKINNSGDLLWHKYINQTGSNITKVVETSDGNILLFLQNLAVPTLMKMDINGSVIWKKYIGKPGYYPSYKNLIKSSDGNILCGVYFGAVDSIPSFQISKLDSDGNQIWKKDYNMNPNPEDYKNMYESSDGNIYVVGTHNPVIYPNSDSVDALVRKFDSNGNYTAGMLYNHQYYDKINDIQESSDGYLIAIGMSKPHSVCGGNLFLMKLRFDLDTIYTKIYGNTTAEGAFYNNLRLIGDTIYTFGAGSLWSTGNYHSIHLLKSSLNFNFSCKSYAQNISTSTVNPLISIPINSYIVDTTLLIPLLDYTSHTNGTYPVFTDACTSTFLGNTNFVHTVEIMLYPNPSSGKINITGFEIGSEYKIFNNLGQIVQSGETVKQIDVSTLKGIFYITLSGEERITKKIIIN